MNILKRLFGDQTDATKGLAAKDPVSFLWLCKENYFKGIRPANTRAKQTENYQSTISVGIRLMGEGKEQEFSGYFMEVQYMVNLWAAHIIIEYVKPDEALKEECLEIITRYSVSSISKVVANEEAKWLEQYNYAQAANEKINDLNVVLAKAIAHYNLMGCQCSFPRFSQIVSVDCCDTGNSFYVIDTEGLISRSAGSFDQEDLEPFPENVKQKWTCKKCKSTYEYGWCDLSISVNRSYLKSIDLKAPQIGKAGTDPIPLFFGPLGHSLPEGKFKQVSLEEFDNYLRG